MTNLQEDFATFVADSSFSDITSDDSSGWMHKIDVSNFKELTSTIPAAADCYQPHMVVGSSSEITLVKPEPKRARFEQEAGDLVSPTVSSSTRAYTKPLYSYSCLIALALKNSRTGQLQVSEIYGFMCENFPYFRTAQPGWKNSVRHNLSLNKCFEKIIVENGEGHGRKCCLWTLNPNKTAKMEQEIRKWRDKDPTGLRESLLNPEDLDIIEMGLKGLPGERKQIVVQTLPDLAPNFRQPGSTMLHNFNSCGNWYYTASTPPRPASYDLHQMVHSTPLRYASASNSPHSSAYSPSRSAGGILYFPSAAYPQTEVYESPSPWKCAAYDPRKSVLSIAGLSPQCSPMKFTLQQL